VLLPGLIAHADWGCDPRKRQVAVATLAGSRYTIVSLAAAPAGSGQPGRGLFDDLGARAVAGVVLVGFDFTIGLPRAYAAAAGITSFPGFLAEFGAPPWHEFDDVAATPGEISLRRPFYPRRPGGTAREHLYSGLGLTAPQLRRRADGSDAETLFWTLGRKQAGKASLDGWRLLGHARASGTGVALWPFDGPLPVLIDRAARARTARFVVAEAYPREFYRQIGAPPRQRWSKRRQVDRLDRVPALLAWAQALGVGWDAAIARRVAAGCADGPAGEDEFDAVVGVLGMIAVVTGVIPAGVPDDDPAVLTTEGWILGRAS
jgi:hypothetical protein